MMNVMSSSDLQQLLWPSTHTHTHTHTHTNTYKYTLNPHNVDPSAYTIDLYEILGEAGKCPVFANSGEF